MKRNAIFLAMLSIMALWLSGCITSSSPKTSEVTIKVGDSQTFTVSGVGNGPYTWTKAGIPVSGNTTASYTYTALLEDLGTFSIKVTTKDSLNVTSSLVWTVNVVNDLPPIANAGPDQNLYFGTLVQLDGSLSSDPEGQPLYYLWEIVGRPAGSSASLDNPNAEKPTFVPDKQGAYTIRLIVNDGRLTSSADTVIINSFTDYGPPTANAGPDQSIVFGNMVSLDGSASTDPEGTPLTYMWAIDSGPAGSAAALDDPTSMTPKFTPDKKGVYVVSLVVSNGLYDSGIDLVTIVVYNTMPVARAGADVTIADLGGSTTLDGSLSSDPDGDPISYSWTIISRPYGSTAALSDPSIVNPTFTPDKKGAYTIQLVVSDGDLFSNADTVIVTCSNHVPVANAGTPIHIPFGNTAQLNGSATDPDSDPMTYAWTITDKPSGSIAMLSNATILNPTFRPDVQGTYTLSLVATDNTGLSSAPSFVTVSTENHQPVADAGDDIIMPSNTSVGLNGSGTDADSDPLTFTWRVITAPMGSGGDSTISDLNIANPTFTPDKKGDYQLGLIVNDGQIDSAESTMKIHVINNPPVADAGPTQNVHYSTRFVTLDGSGSFDVDGDPLTYSWRIVSKPSGSTAVIVNPTDIHPTITLDVPQGSWVIGLTVNDGAIDSAESTVSLNYIENQPVANAGPNQSRHTAYGVPNTFQLDGSGSSDLDGDALTYAWTLKSAPSGSTAALSNRYIVNPTITADKVGAYVIGLIVNDGLMNSAESTVTITYTNNTPVANAGPNQSKHSPLTFQLDGSGSSDLDGDPLAYTWRVISKPSGSASVLSSTNIVNPTITADKLGSYVIGLTASDGFVNSTENTVTLTVTNAAPVANAGPNQSRHTSLTFQLDGSGSSDGDSDPLTYSWRIISKPSGSASVLSSTTIVNPTITTDRPGAYSIGLTVNDGWVNSTESTVTITYTNNAPVANAGTYADVLYANRNGVTLNGGASSDPDGDAITYAWTMTGKPSGSAAALANANTATPSFNMDVPGTYSFSLVVSDAWVSSSASTASVSSSMSALSTNWDDNVMSPWYQITKSNMGTCGIATNESHSSPRSFRTQSCTGVLCGSGTYKFGRDINKYVTTISFWSMTYFTYSYPNVDLYEGSTKLADINNYNSWTQSTYTYNRMFGTLAFQDNGSYAVTGRTWNVDDIVINVWN